MTPECFAPEDLDEILALSEADPRQAHAASCARCGALIEQYRLYLEAKPPEDESFVPDAEQELRRRLARAIAPESAPVAPSPRAGPGRRRPSWRSRLFHPAMRPAWALAAVIAVLGIVVFRIEPRLPDREPVLRGPDGNDGVPALERAELGPRGLELRWRSVPGADAYRVRFYSAGELRDLGHRDAGPDTVLHLATGAFPGARSAADTIVVQVEALVEGDVIGVSGPRALGSGP